MNIYWRRQRTFLPYPNNQEIDKQWIEYSKSKRKFKSFMSTETNTSEKERIALISENLGVNKKRIKLQNNKPSK